MELFESDLRVWEQSTARAVLQMPRRLKLSASGNAFDRRAQRDYDRPCATNKKEHPL